MTQENAQRYALAGFFALILGTPLLAFWRPTSWARWLTAIVLLVSILGCWRFFEAGRIETSQLTMLIMTVTPATVAAAVAGLVELYLRRRRVTAVGSRRTRYHRHSEPRQSRRQRR